MNKVINISDMIIDEESGKDIAHFTCMIDTDVKNFAMNIQLTNKEFFEKNKSKIKSECEKFITASMEEAINSGWDILDSTKK